MLTLVHETAHYIKRFSKYGTSIDILRTIEEDNLYEGGKIFLQYLFNKPSINLISVEQAKSLLDINIWKDGNQLRKIFETTPDNTSPTISFMLSEEDACWCLRSD